MSNVLLFADLFAYRFMLLEIFGYDEDNDYIINKLKYRLIEMDINYNDINDFLYDFYNHYEINISLEEIRNSLVRDYIINDILLSIINNPIEEVIDNDNDNDNDNKHHKSNYMFRVQGNNIKWKLQKIIRQTYNIVILIPYNKHIMEIYTGDIIEFDNNKYSIFMRLYQFLLKKNIYEDDDKYDTMCIILENLKTDEQKEYTTQELIDLFENEDITYIKTQQFNCLNDKKKLKL